MTVRLAASNLCAGYGRSTVVRNIDLEVDAGEVVALLGSNGAGKTTTLLALSGDHPLSGGEVRIDGEATTSHLHRRAVEGLALLPEGRSVFPSLTVRENLRVARGDVDRALELFPALERLLARRAGLLSGGEQQMLSLARILSREVRILLADELSMGLAPVIVERLLSALRRAADDGLAVLLVEQHAQHALAVADRAYVLRRGQIVTAANVAEFRSDPGLLRRSSLGELQQS